MSLTWSNRLYGLRYETQDCLPVCGVIKNPIAVHPFHPESSGISQSRHMKLSLIAVFALMLVACPILDADNETKLDLAEAHKAAAEAKSLFLDSDARVRAVDTFVDLVRIKGVSGQEQAIRS